MSKEERRRLAERVLSRGCRSFGQGPSRCKVHVVGNVVTIRVFGFMTPLEQLLVDAGERALVLEVRRQVLDATMADWRADFDSVGMEIVSASALTDFERNVRTLIFRAERA